MNKGFQVAVMEALDGMNKAYQDLVHVDANVDVTYHFVLTVERL